MSIQFRRLRHQATMPVTVQSDKWVGSAQVLDLNDAGSRLSVNGNMQVGQKVTVVIGEDRISGLVRWVGEGRVGVAFVPKLSPKLVSKLRFGGDIKRRLNPRYDSSALREMR